MNSDFDQTCYNDTLVDGNTNATHAALKTTFEGDHYKGSDPIYVHLGGMLFNTKSVV